MCLRFVQQCKAHKSSLAIRRNDCSLYLRLYIACQTRKGDLPEFFRHKNQWTPPSLSKLGDMRTGKKGRLAEVSWTLPSWIWEFWRGRSPGRWNQQHWLWRDGWPCQHDIAIEKFISGTELEPCMQEEEQLISKNTAAYIAADHSPEADVKILDSAFVVQMLSHRTSLSRTTATASFCLTFLDNFRVFNGYYLGCLSHRQLEGQDKKQTGGPRSTSLLLKK